jgi:transposase
VTERLRVREIDDDEGRRLVRIIRRGSGSVVTWRRAQMVLLSAQGMDVPAIAKVAFTSEDRVRDVIRNFNADGFSSLYPKYKGGHPPKFTLRQRREIKKIAKSKPAEHDLPFSTWSLAKLADFLVAEGVGRRHQPRGPAGPAPRRGRHLSTPETWKASKDPRYAAKKACVEHLYAVADREITPADGDPAVVFCVDEFGPLNLQPRPGRQWAAVSGKGKEPGRAPRPRMRHLHPQGRGPASVRRL